VDCADRYTYLDADAYPYVYPHGDSYSYDAAALS